MWSQPKIVGGETFPQGCRSFILHHFHDDINGTFVLWFAIYRREQTLLEMIQINGDIFEKVVPQQPLPFSISKIFHFYRQKRDLR